MDFIKHLLENNVIEAIERESLEKRLASGKKLRIKLGFDPTRPDLHLGHYVVLKKLKEFQELGHKVIFIIGDATALIGDPSGRNQARPALTKKEIAKNAKTYFEQVGKVINSKKSEIYYNSQWFSKFKLDDFLNLLGSFTIQRILERDDFSNRLKAQTEIFSHEIIYPMLQAYDSIMIKADIEIGGADQKFNMLAGRDLARRFGEKEQDIITCPLLVGLDGKKKMSKSYDNYVAFLDSSQEKFGKIMSLPDESMREYFKLVLNYSDFEIEEISEKIKNENPKDIKMELAFKIVKLFDGAKKAEKARKNFINVFSKRQAPKEIKTVFLKGNFRADDLLVKLGLASSKSEAKRLIEQNGVYVDNNTLDSWIKQITIPQKGLLIKVGKLKILKVLTPKD